MCSNYTCDEIIFFTSKACPTFLFLFCRLGAGRKINDMVKRIRQVSSVFAFLHCNIFTLFCQRSNHIVSIIDSSACHPAGLSSGPNA